MKELKIYINFNTSPTVAVATVASHKYNKLGCVMQQWDDGIKAGWDIAKTIWSSGYTYTDGCGNNINYVGDIAINIGTGDVGDIGYNPNYLQVPDLKEIINSRGDIMNHSAFHSEIDPMYQTKILDDLINLRADYKMRTFVIPTNYSGFADASYEIGYLGITSEGDYFDQFNPTRFHKIIPDLPYPTYFPMIRDFIDDWDNPNKIDFFKGQIDLLFNGQRNFYIIGTHSALETNDKKNGFIDLYSYLRTRSNDRILMCSMREFLEYKEMANLPITQELVNNTLIVKINIDNLSSRNSWKDISLNISSDSLISSVTGDGFDNYSFNPSTGLVNAFKRVIDFSTPVEINRIKVNKKLILKNEEPSFDVNLTPEEQTATGAWYAASTLKYNSNTQALDGDHIGKIVDKIGNNHILYTGWGIDHVDGSGNPQKVPILNGPPKLNTTGLDIPYIKMWNLPHLGYESLDFPFRAGVPYVIGFIMELHPYGDYEALFPGNMGYIGTINYNIRAGHNTYEIQGTTLPIFKRIFVQVEFKEFEINVYHNGILKGTHINDLNFTDSDKRIKDSLFVDTNNACWNFFALYDWRGAQYNTLMNNKTHIDNVIINKFGCGLDNPKPHAYALSANFNTTSRIWTANMSTANATQEQIDNATFMWMLKGETTPGNGIGAFSNQRPLASTNKTLNESEYLSLSQGDRIQLTPYVSIGGWDYIKGETKDI